MSEAFKDATTLRLRPPRTLSKRVVQILDRLEKRYGVPKPPYPTDPYEMILHRNAGYPQSDERCGKGFQALKKQIGLAPKNILAASDEALCDAARHGGMIPELRAQRFRDIAARVLEEFGGNMRAVMKRPLPGAKRALKKFPTVADATAEGASRAGLGYCTPPLLHRSHHALRHRIFALHDASTLRVAAIEWRLWCSAQQRGKSPTLTKRAWGTRPWASDHESRARGNCGTV